MSGDVAAWVPVATALAGLGGALGTQWLSHRFTVGREKKASEENKAAKRVFIGCQLMLIIVDYRERCREYVDSAGNETYIVPTPELSELNSVKGDWSVLSATLQLRINRLSYRRFQINQELCKVFDHLGVEEYRDNSAALHEKVVAECDVIIEELMTNCGLPSPWTLDE